MLPTSPCTESRASHPLPAYKALRTLPESVHAVQNELRWHSEPTDWSLKPTALTATHSLVKRDLHLTGVWRGYPDRHVHQIRICCICHCHLLPLELPQPFILILQGFWYTTVYHAALTIPLPYLPIYTGLSGESSSWLPTTSTKGEAIKKVYTTTLWEEKEVHRIFGIPPSWWHCQHTLLRNHGSYHTISIIVTYQSYTPNQILPHQKEGFKLAVFLENMQWHW